MVIIAADCIINMNQVECVYAEDGYLIFEASDGRYRLVDCPENALQLIAVGLAQGKSFIEMDGAKLVVGGTDDN